MGAFSKLHRVVPSLFATPSRSPSFLSFGLSTCRCLVCDLSFDSLILLSIHTHQGPCNNPTPSTTLCGTYNWENCSADASGLFNVQSAWQFYGAAVGTFHRNYKVYQGNDTACGNAVSLYTIFGQYALHGPSNCGGTCQVRRCSMVEAYEGK